MKTKSIRKHIENPDKEARKATPLVPNPNLITVDEAKAALQKLSGIASALTEARELIPADDTATTDQLADAAKIIERARAAYEALTV